MRAYISKLVHALDNEEIRVKEMPAGDVRAQLLEVCADIKEQILHAEVDLETGQIKEKRIKKIDALFLQLLNPKEQ